MFFSSLARSSDDVPYELVVAIAFAFIFHFDFHFSFAHILIFCYFNALSRSTVEYEKCFTWEIPLHHLRCSRFSSLFPSHLINSIKFSFN